MMQHFQGKKLNKAKTKEGSTSEILNKTTHPTE
jgi:hypothetical protein